MAGASLIKALVLQGLIVLALSCGVREIEVTQNPFKGQADYKWDKDVLLTENEQENIFMYGIKITIPEGEIDFCSGYSANICIGKDIIDYVW